MTTVTITVGYTIGNSKEEMKKADELYKEFNERFLKEFPKAKLARTYIQKIAEDKKERRKKI